MDCNYAAKVSMLVDGELSAEEIETVKNHLADCADCQSLEKDFLFFREQIKESVEAKEFAPPDFSSQKQTPFWKKAIAMPIPVFAAIVLFLAVAGGWLIAPRFNQTPDNLSANPPKKDSPKNDSSPNETSLARYDKGGRAEIYVTSQKTKRDKK